MLLIPLLGIVFNAGATAGRLQTTLIAGFHALGIETPLGRLTLLIAIFALLMIVRSVVTTRRDILLAELQITFLDSRRGQIAELLAGASWGQVIKLRHARIAHLMSGDIQRMGTGIYFMMRSGVSLVMLVTQCALAFVLSPALAAISFALLVVIGIAILPMMRRSERLGRFVTHANLTLLNSTTQYLGGLKMAISQNLQSGFAREFNETLNALSRAQIDNMRQNSYSRTAVAVLSALVGAGLVLVGYGLFHVPAPTLIVLLAIISRMSGPAGQIQQGAQTFAHALPAYEKVRELAQELAAVPKAEPQSGSAILPAGTIAFENVSFHHAPADAETPAPGVRNLSLRLAQGEFAGIGGPSGAGKTTFADLLVGLFPPQEGRITVGGEPLTETVLAAWRNGVGYVSQDPFLFHDTVRRNLSWANPQADESQMWRALGITEAADLVRRMEHGLDTVVGERGTLMSGGERQRIALARAILRAPRLLVLDEATNAIDIATEHRILERLRDMKPRPTVVIIAHRPESLELCERTLRMEAGRLIGGAGPERHVTPRELQKL